MHISANLLATLLLLASVVFPMGTAAQSTDQPSVRGVWEGEAISGETLFDYRWEIDQSHSSVTGEISIKYIASDTWSTFEFKGKISGAILEYSGTRWVTENSAGFCLPTGQLKLTKSSARVVMAGKWASNPITGGCPKGTGGDVYLTQINPAESGNDAQAAKDRLAANIARQNQQELQQRKEERASRAARAAAPKPAPPKSSAATPKMKTQVVPFIREALMHGKFCGEIRKNVAVISQGSEVFDYFKTKNGCGARAFTGANFEFTFRNLKSEGCVGSSRCRFSTRIQCVWQGLIMAPNCEGFEGAGLTVSGSVFFLNGKAHRYVIE